MKSPTLYQRDFTVSRTATDLAPNQFGLPSQLPKLIGGSRLRAINTLLILISCGLLAIIQWEPAPVDLAMPLLALVLILNTGIGIPRIRTSLVLTSALAFMLATQAISIYRSSEFNVSLRYWLITVFMALICLAGYGLGQRRDLFTIAFTGMVVVYALTSFVAILGHIGILPISEIVSFGGVRLQAFTKNPNTFGQYSAVILVLVSEHLLRSEAGSLLRLGRKIALVALLITVTGLILSASRASMGAAVLSLLFLMGLHMIGQLRWKPTRIVAYAALLPFVAIILYTLLPAGLTEYITNRLNEDVSEDHRFVVQRAALQEFWEFPFLGHGPVSTALDLGMGTHNVYVMLLYEHGALGFFLVMAVWLIALGAALRFALTTRDPLVKRVSCVFASILVGQYAFGLVVDIIHVRHVWLFVGMAAALQLLQRNRAGATSDSLSDIQEAT